MGDVLRTTSEPMLGQIRLAWWRERLQELDVGGRAPAEPRLRAVAAELIPCGIAARDLAPLEDGWLQMFEPFPWTHKVGASIAARGRRLFGLGSRIVAQGNDSVEEPGAIWALVDAARHCSDLHSQSFLIEQARQIAAKLDASPIARELRPLSMLAATALRDVRRPALFEPEGTPARAFTMLRHRISGRIGVPNS